MDKKEALKVWFHEYGNNEYAYDITGRKIKREDYQKTKSVGLFLICVRLNSEDRMTMAIQSFSIIYRL